LESIYPDQVGSDVQPMTGRIVASADFSSKSVAIRWVTDDALRG